MASTNLNPQAPEFFPNNHRQIHYYFVNPLRHHFFQPPNPNPSFYYYHNPLPPLESSQNSVPAVTQPLHEASDAVSPRNGKRGWNRRRHWNYWRPSPSPINEEEEADKQSWRRKGDSSYSKTCPKRRPDRKINYSSGGGSRSIKAVVPVESDGYKTTVMIRNIPNRYTRKSLMEMIDKQCNKANEESRKRKEKAVLAFDFLYLPMDFENGANKGYAFVNFTDPKGVWKFREAVQNRGWPLFESKKVCSLAYARVQGKQELVRHFQGSMFECDSEDYLPVCFTPARDGSGSVVQQKVIGKRVSNYYYLKERSK